MVSPCGRRGTERIRGVRCRLPASLHNFSSVPPGRTGRKGRREQSAFVQERRRTASGLNAEYPHTAQGLSASNIDLHVIARKERIYRDTI